MQINKPTYISTPSWDDLISRLTTDHALRQRMGVSVCPGSGKVEEYLVADQLGGMLNIWPEKWRGIIEADQEA